MLHHRMVVNRLSFVIISIKRRMSFLPKHCLFINKRNGGCLRVRIMLYRAGTSNTNRDACIERSICILLPRTETAITFFNYR